MSWGAGTPGTEGTTITLGTLAATANGLAGRPRRHSVAGSERDPDWRHSQRRPRAQLHRPAGHTSVDVTSWTLSSLTIATTSDTDFILTATATAGRQRRQHQHGDDERARHGNSIGPDGIVGGERARCQGHDDHATGRWRRRLTAWRATATAFSRWQSAGSRLATLSATATGTALPAGGSHVGGRHRLDLSSLTITTTATRTSS